MDLPNVRLLHLAQGLFGAPSAKPTTLLVLGMPTLEAELHAQRVTTELPHGLSVGKDDFGQFKTAPLKEYPPAMCKGIASALCTDVISIECNDTTLPTDLVQRCIGMTNQFFGDFIGHDG